MATTLWASAADRRRIETAGSAVLLVGSYDGSGNFGDVLQLAVAIETVRGLRGGPLPIAVIERETHAHHATLLERYPGQLGAAAFVHYHEGGEAADDGLLELGEAEAPARSALYLYGGGYLNGRWGARKALHAAAAERLAGGGPLPVVASGLQADEETIAAGGAAHELLSRARWIGVRDAISLENVSAHVECPVELCGDDAVPRLRFPPAPVEPVVNLHINPGEWVSGDIGLMARRIAGLLRGLGEASAEALELQPVIAYEDPRVSERRAVSSLLEEHGDALEGAGLTVGPPLDLLEDATGNELLRFRRARLSVACSYHVTLASLLAGVPAVLLAENAYYGQKAAGLRGLFGLDEGTVGIRGTADDVPALLSAAQEGPVRDDLLECMRRGSARVVERFERGRQRVASTLDAALEEQGRARAPFEPPTMLAAMSGRFSTRLALFLERFAWLLRAEPAQGSLPPDIVDRIAESSFKADLSGARSDYAIEMASNTPLLLRMLALRSWLDLNPTTDGPLVSVVLATRDRPDVLRRAISTVLAQRYRRWQLIVVDDGETGAVPATLAGLAADERVVVVEGPRRGLGAARNAGLAHVSGGVVCYLDDDNLMHPDWLHAVAYLFSTREDVEVAYGVTLTEHRSAGDLGEEWWPSHWQLPWSRETLLERNITDAGAIAHRPGLEEARFDEELSTGEDWDMLIRLTSTRPAIAIPAVSHAYAMEGDGRMTDDPEHLAGLERIRRRHAARSRDSA